MRLWLAEYADIIFYGLLVSLCLAEVVLRWLVKLRKDHVIMEYVDSGFIAIILALVIRVFLVQTFIIPSVSMENTLLIGDQLIVNKFIYGTKLPFFDKSVLRFKSPQRGDVIVFRDVAPTNKRLIKRCLGLPGETIEMKNKVLYVNGSPLKEPYVVWKDGRTFTGANNRDNFGPIAVPPDQYLMLGDNRDQSADSRYWGFLPRSMIEGKAWVIYWPVSRWRVVK